jgi:hypothetical protein
MGAHWSVLKDFGTGGLRRVSALNTAPSWGFGITHTHKRTHARASTRTHTHKRCLKTVTKVFLICCVIRSKKKITALCTRCYTVPMPRAASAIAHSVTWLGYGLGDSCLNAGRGQEIFFSPTLPDRLWGPHYVLFQGHWEGRATGSVRLSAELNVVPILRIRRPLFLCYPYVLSRRGQHEFKFCMMRLV